MWSKKHWANLTVIGRCRYWSLIHRTDVFFLQVSQRMYNLLWQWLHLRLCHGICHESRQIKPATYALCANYFVFFLLNIRAYRCCLFIWWLLWSNFHNVSLFSRVFVMKIWIAWPCRLNSLRILNSVCRVQKPLYSTRNKWQINRLDCMLRSRLITWIRISFTSRTTLQLWMHLVYS